MVSLTAELQKQLEQVAFLAKADVAKLMALLENYPAKEWAEIIRETIPSIFDNYAPLATDLSVSFYNRNRALVLKDPAAPKKIKNFAADFKAVNDSKLREKFAANVSYHVSRAFREVPENALTLLEETTAAKPQEMNIKIPEAVAAKRKEIAEQIQLDVEKQMFDVSRETIHNSAKLDPAPVEPIRILDANGCDFCKAAVLEGATQGDFHKACKCVVSFSIDGKQKVSAWEGDWKTRYSEAIKIVGSDADRNAIIAQMQKMANE